MCLGSERTVDFDTGAGGDDLDLAIVVIEDRPGDAAREGCETDDTGADGESGVEVVAVDAVVELRIRCLAAAVVHLVHPLVVRRRVAGEDGRADESQHTATGHRTSRGDATLLRRHRRRHVCDGHDERPPDEHASSAVVVPRVARVGSHGREDLQLGGGELRLDSEVEERVEADRLALRVPDHARCGGDEATGGVRSRRTGRDREYVRQAVLDDVVGRRAVRGGAELHLPVPRGVEEPHRAARERFHRHGEIRERQAAVRARCVACGEYLFVRVPARRRAGHGDENLAVFVGHVPGVLGEPYTHLVGRRIVHHDEDLDVAPLPQDVGHESTVRLVGGVARHGGHAGTLAPQDDAHGGGSGRRGTATHHLDGCGTGGGKIGRGGQGGKEQEECQAASGYALLGLCECCPRGYGRAKRSQKLRKSQFAGRVIAIEFCEDFLHLRPVSVHGKSTTQTY